VNTTYLCGEAGCRALGVAFITAILILALLGMIYVTWRDWAVRYLEEMEEDIRRERDLKATDQDEEAA
jgi:hypothetical protein